MARMVQRNRRGGRIALTDDEVDDFLRRERTCRLGTVGGDGRPHVTPLWFVWDGTSLWLNSIVKSQRWTDLQRAPHVSVLVDGGVDFLELVGVEIKGTVEVVGEVPRTGEVNPELVEPERLFARKYANSDDFTYDGRHAWLRVVPEKIVSWDFSKMTAG